MRHPIAPVLAAIAVLATPVAAAERPTDADAAFARLGTRYIDQIARLSPVNGTRLGDHRFDDKLPDLSAAGRAAATAAEKTMLADLARIDRSTLSRDNQVDWLLLDNALRADIWDAEVLQRWAWNAQTYNDVAAGALYSLAARDYAPWPQGLKAATARIEALPALMAQGREALTIARMPAVYATGTCFGKDFSGSRRDVDEPHIWKDCHACSCA